MAGVPRPIPLGSPRRSRGRQPCGAAARAMHSVGPILNAALRAEGTIRVPSHNAGRRTRLRALERKELQLLEAVLDCSAQLVRERLQAFLRAAVVEAQ